MFAVMKELARNKYNGTIYPEHPRALDYDREHGPYLRLSRRRRLHRRCLRRGLCALLAMASSSCSSFLLHPAFCVPPSKQTQLLTTRSLSANINIIGQKRVLIWRVDAVEVPDATITSDKQIA